MQPMNRDRVEGFMRQLSGSLRERWGLLTSDRLDVVAGRCEQLMGLAQVRDGIRKELAARQQADSVRHSQRVESTGARQL